MPEFGNRGAKPDRNRTSTASESCDLAKQIAEISGILAKSGDKKR
jgi:hypothetical protein